jgi:poly(A) polymerase
MTATPIDPLKPEATVSLKTAEWLNDKRLQQLMQVVAGSDEEIRVVGGAIRNALMGYPVADVDLATTALPEIVIDRTRAAGLKPIPTGIDHGTITVVVAGKPYEVTTLREDVATDGRRAKVKFGRDWTADAARRDFTVNALYADALGNIVDFVDGIADCRARRIRFIGAPETRIREDYLRILRLFRFHAAYGDGLIDAPGLDAAVHLRDGILTLSSERIGQEMLKLVSARHAPDVLRVMQETGILSLALGTDAIDLERFARIHALATASRAADPEDLIGNPVAIQLASLAANGIKGCEQFVKRLRLSNAMRDRMTSAWAVSTLVKPDIDDRYARALIFRLGKQAYCDAMLLAAGTPGFDWPIERVGDLLRLGYAFAPPKLPINGHDLLALGIAGQSIGTTLATLTDIWIASDFTLTKNDLLAQVMQSKTESN